MASDPKDASAADESIPEQTATTPADKPAVDSSGPAAADPPLPAETSQPPARQTDADADQKPTRAAGLAGLRVQIGSLRDRPGTPKTAPKLAPATESQHGSDAARPRPDTLRKPTAPKRYPTPSVRDRLPPDLEREVAAALDGMSLDSMMAGCTPSAGEGAIAPETPIQARVITVGREEIFFDLGGRNQGVIARRQFETPPEPAALLDVVVHRFDADDGLYELSLPGAVSEVGDWSQVTEGLVVEATVTGHNKGGLECQVGALRGFIPVSQVSLYRVENLDEYVGQKFACLVAEANPARRNLVLSRRAVLERENAEAKERLWEQLAVGQIRTGVVRRLQEFGAFVDLGGVDGLIHISQLSWERIGHPGEVLQEGQQVRVKVEKIDRAAGRIGLAYRDLLENPWTGAGHKYPVSSHVKGTVTKVMEFGALVKLEPGVAGLIHISELSHNRVWRVSDVVHVGQEVEAQVLSVDPVGQRIGLSLRALEVRPRTEAGKKAGAEAAPEPADPEAPKGPPQRRPQNLKGGLDRGAGGEHFGLKW